MGRRRGSAGERGRHASAGGTWDLADGVCGRSVSRAGADWLQRQQRGGWLVGWLKRCTCT